MLDYSYEIFTEDVKKLVEQTRSYAPDTIIAIARGGMMLGQMLGYGLNVRNVQTVHMESYDGDAQRDRVEVFGTCDFSRSKRVLIVDDIADSGKTLEALVNSLDGHEGVTIKTAVIFYKKGSVVAPDYKLHEATEWINFFWEQDDE
jgi:xanthine phosphoribosyltransferase